MANKTCDYCGEPFIPREAKARFCCASCRIAYHDEERREAVQRYRQQQNEERAS